ncbi:MAG: hypothetical protein ACRELV_01535, partial [Longimicrobiales bacterium]
MSKTTSRGAAALGAILIAGTACTPAGVRPAPMSLPAPFPLPPPERVVLARQTVPAIADPTPDVRGHSGALRVLLAMPGEIVAVPLRWLGHEPERVRYAWQAEPSTRTASSTTGARFAAWEDADLIGRRAGGPTARLGERAPDLDFAPL